MQDYRRVGLPSGHTLEIPPGLSGGVDQGVDTRVATWSGPGIRILVDEGPFADPLMSYAERLNYWTSEEAIDGQPGRIAGFEEEGGTRVVAAHLPGSGAGSGLSDRLTLVIHLEPGEDQEVALRVIRSFRFGKR